MHTQFWTDTLKEVFSFRDIGVGRRMILNRPIFEISRVAEADCAHVAQNSIRWLVAVNAAVCHQVPQRLGRLNDYQLYSMWLFYIQQSKKVLKLQVPKIKD
jgi:hypothetical protein